MIETIVTCLVDNSRQAGAMRVDLVAACDGDRVRLTVTDDGAGIPPADRDRIFDPFFTNRRILARSVPSRQAEGEAVWNAAETTISHMHAIRAIV